MTVRLGIFVSHPVQYAVPIWRRLAQEPGVEVRVHFFSDCSVRGEVDPGFGVPVSWDVPLLDGYEHRFLDRSADRDDFRSANIPHAHRLLSAGRFDWIMVQGYRHPFERQAVVTARDLGMRTLMRGEFTDDPRPDRPWWLSLVRDSYLRWFYRKISAFCYLGCNGLEHLISHGVPRQRLFFSPYAVDTALFEEHRLKRSRSQARAALGIPEDRLTVLFSGKLIPRKCPLLLLEALRRLENRHRIHLIVVGDGPLRAEVETAARALLGSHVTMPGFVNQSALGDYFAAADVFVLPSSYETWGLVVNEAMQFGLPVVVSSRVGCHRDLVVPDRTGFVFQSGDAAGLAGCLQAFLGDPLRTTRMGAAARAQIGGYTTEASAQGILAALTQSRASRPRGADSDEFVRSNRGG